MRPKLQIRLARGHRKEPTPSEALLWNGLREDRLAGLHFRRQHPVQATRFIADFCCIALKLIIEIDGGYHNEPEQGERDKERQMLIAELGYTFCRFSDEQVTHHLPEVLQTIADAAERVRGGGGVVLEPPPPSPLPRSAGEGE